MKPHETIMKFIPDGDRAYNLGEIKCRSGNKNTALVPTDKRLIMCKSGFLGINKEVDDYKWGKFDHVKISKKWGNYNIELRLRGGRGTLRLEKFDKENFEAFYRRIQERISRFDEKFKISSKICPQCGEIIKFVAKECPHCSHLF